MNIFFAPNISSKDFFTVLSEEESIHAIRVLRMKKGDVIQLVDGKGNFYTGEIIDAHPKKCAVTIKETKTNLLDNGKNIHLHIAIAPVKNISRFEWFLEKVTEIGIDEITPLACCYSERTSVKIKRLNKILISAMKQTIKAYLPVLNEMQEFKTFIESSKKNSEQKFIAHLFPIGQETKSPLLNEVCNSGTDALIVIGPEGGFAEEEVLFAEKNGFSVVSLGTSRLRSETAGVVACTIVNMNNNKKYYTFVDNKIF
ncbi:MAG: 16S rRNA (uracil(1498)-N(3))-methyltransferase [Bacteroidota bacterium]